MTGCPPCGDQAPAWAPRQQDGTHAACVRAIERLAAERRAIGLIDEFSQVRRVDGQEATVVACQIKEAKP